MANNSDGYDLKPYLPLLYSFLLFWFFLLIILKIYYAQILNYVKKVSEFIFQRICNNSKTLDVLAYLISKLFFIRGAFEIEHKSLPYLMSLPYIIFTTDYIFHFVPWLDKPFLWGIFYCTLGLDMIILDSIGSQISLFISENGDHVLSQKIQTYLTSQDMIARGFFKGAGRLSAAGQAAIYAGSLAFGSTVAVTILNNHHDLRKTKLKYEYKSQEKQKDREWEAYMRSWNPFKKPPKS